MSHFALDLDA